VALPERGRAQDWVGRTVVDRDGAEIGVCRAVLTDDGTGLPEWLYADIAGRTVIVPLVDAAEIGERVQVAVSRVDVGTAPPPTGDTQHLSQGEEAALYQHYGIEYSRAASDTLLPADVASGVATEGEAVADRPDTGGAAPFGRVVPGLVTALAGLGLLVAVVLRRRRRSQPAPRRAGRWARAGAASAGRAATIAARRAGAASLTAAALTKVIAEASVPLVSASGRVVGRGTSAGAGYALHAADASIRFAAAAVPRVAARGLQVGQTSLGAAVKLGDAVGSGAEMVSETGDRLQKAWKTPMSRLSLGLGLGVGYVLGARAGRARFEQIKRVAAGYAERPEVRQALDKAKDAVPATLQNSIGALSERPSGVSAKMRRRPADGNTVDTAGTPQIVDADTVVTSSNGPVPPPEPFGAPGSPHDGPERQL
jgi:hypothetical protein